MSPQQPQKPSPPQLHHPITNSHVIPDIFLTALSIFFLFSSSCSCSCSSSTTCTTPKIPFLPFQIKPRRFPKLPSISISMSTHLKHPFPNPQSLSDWLKPRLPSDSFSSWGVKPGTKNVHNLWLELTDGETSLVDSTPPVRTVNVVSLRIVGPNNLVLVESHQELSDGSIRDRFRPLSEKIKPHETPEAAAFRAVKEELGSVLEGIGVVGGVVRIVPGSYKEKIEERCSVSYPGLPAKYVLHSLDVVVDGLPVGEFCTEEVEDYGDSEERMEAASQAVSVRRHFWKWVSPDSVKS